MFPVTPLTHRPLVRAMALLGLLLPLVSSCLQPFNPPEIGGGRGFLVVDGYLDTGGDTTTIRLTRTQNLTDTELPPAESGAQVSIEENRGVSFRLTEAGRGRYLLTNALRPDEGQYRLRIRTSGGREYVSDYVAVKTTPTIDSLNWDAGDGLQIYINTHDPAGNTRYYRWEFSETWEFYAPYNVDYFYQRGAKNRIAENISQCWTTTLSRNVVLGTSARLSEDIIYRYPLILLPPTSEKHQVRYSILVKQYALTREGYDYWLNLKRNTEDLGTLFDPQPSQVSSNIRSVNNPEEPVLGFFSAYSVQEKRIFITRNELPRGWRRMTGYEDCQVDSIKVNNYAPNVLQNMTFPVIGDFRGPVPGYLTSDLYCIDCRLAGTNKRPSFW